MICKEMYAYTFRDFIAVFEKCKQSIRRLLCLETNDPQLPVRAICSQVRDVCPNLFHSADLSRHQATDLLRSGISSDDYVYRVYSALHLWEDAGRNDSLDEICLNFTQPNRRVGQLCQTCASMEDVALALEFHRSNQSIEDHVGYAAYTTSMKYYKGIKLMLERIHDDATATQSAEWRHLNNSVLQIIAMVLNIGNRLLDGVIYEWMISHNAIYDLLIVSDRQSLGEFLIDSIAKSPNNLKLSDILWEFNGHGGHCTMEVLKNGPLLDIFELLPRSDLASVACVSHRFNDLAQKQFRVRRRVR